MSYNQMSYKSSDERQFQELYEERLITKLMYEGKFDKAEELQKKINKMRGSLLTILQQQRTNKKKYLQLFAGEKTKIEELFLTHATQRQRTYFNMMSNEEKAHVMDYIEYLPEGIRFKNWLGEEICLMEHTDVQAATKRGKIKNTHVKFNEYTECQFYGGARDRQSHIADVHTTFFKRKEIQDDPLIPSVYTIERILHMMPAGDFTDKYKSCRAASQLYGLMGGAYPGTVEAIDHKFSGYGNYGTYWCGVADHITGRRDEFEKDQPGWLWWEKDTGDGFHPVRRLVKPAAI